METSLFTRTDVDEYAEMSDIISTVEDAFSAHAAGKTRMPAKSYIELAQYEGDFRSMPAYVETPSWEAAGLKWVNAHPNNPREHGLPAVMGVMIYSDPETAYPLAIIDGTELTRQRTAAAAAVATDHLARADATRLGIVGAGAQSIRLVDGIANVRDIDEIVINDSDEAAIERFTDHFQGRFTIERGTKAEAGHCDILSTLTPVTDPIVSRSDVAPGTHVNAMGADAAGKQELDEHILLDSVLVIDDHEQCRHSGEINVPWAAGQLTESDIDATLGEVIRGTREGRRTDDDITLFDSTGLAIQDVAAARVIYENAPAATGLDLLEVD